SGGSNPIASAWFQIQIPGLARRCARALSGMETDGPSRFASSLMTVASRTGAAGCPQALHVRGEPLPRFHLHGAIELVRRVIQPAPLVFGHARFSKARVDLSKCLLDAVRREQRVFRSIDDKDRARRNQRGKI